MFNTYQTAWFALVPLFIDRPFSQALVNFSWLLLTTFFTTKSTLCVFLLCSTRPGELGHGLQRETRARSVRMCTRPRQSGWNWALQQTQATHMIPHPTTHYHHQDQTSILCGQSLVREASRGVCLLKFELIHIIKPSTAIQIILFYWNIHHPGFYSVLGCFLPSTWLLFFKN